VELGKFSAGDNPVITKRKERARLTLEQAFEQYMELHAVPKGCKRVDDFRAIWERCIGRMPATERKRHGRARTKHPAGVDWSARYLDEIPSADVRRLHAQIGATRKTLPDGSEGPHQRVMANSALEVLRSVYQRAIEYGYQGENPASGIGKFKKNKRDRFIQSAELPTFFAALGEDTSEDFKHFVLLALLTGARRTNVLSARWQDINLAEGTWRIPDTKSGEPLLLPLVPEAVEILKQRNPKREGYVFPAESKSGHMTPPKKRWQALAKRAGAEDIRIHDLRRSLGSWQARVGASLVVIGRTLGHKSPESTAIYARLSMEPVRAAMESATSAMLVAGGIKAPVEVTPIRRKRKPGARGG
jgi:integrase